MYFLSGGQGQTFSMAAHTMTERIRKIGPNPLKKTQPALPSQSAKNEPEDEDNGFRGRRKSINPHS
jgi:DNA-binding ferritin-like protein